MEILTSLWRDEALRYAVGTITGFSLLALALVLFRRRKLLRAIELLDAHLEDVLEGRKQEPGPQEEARALWRAIRELLVFPPGMQPVPLPALIRAEPSQGLREACRALFRHSWGHALGKSLTGVSLVMTFGLLGMVLVGPVREALMGGGGAGASQAQLLSVAIGQMGAKFFVSAMGLVGSFLFQSVASIIESLLLARLDAMRPRFESATRTLEAHDIVLATERGDALGTLKDELVQTRRELSERLLRLENVEVTLQDIGTHVLSTFGSMMKEQVGDVITRQLSAVERAVREIAADLQRSISSGFALTLQQEMSMVRDSLGSIQQSLSSRQEHDLGRILEQLRDSVSGGFHSQSQDMARQMQQLMGVLPRLEQQFETMARMMGTQAQQWGEENQRAIHVLNERVATVVESFDRVRDGLVSATAGVLAASKESSQQLGVENQQMLGHLERSVESVVGRFEQVLAGMDASTQRLVQSTSQSAQHIQQQAGEQADFLSRQVEALRAAANVDMSNFQSRSEEFARVMGTTQDGLRQLTEQLRNTAAQLVSATRGAGETQDKARGAAAQMEQVTRQLSETAKEFMQVAQSRREVAKVEEGLLSAQRQAFERVQPVLDGLARNYEESVQRQAQTLSGKWGKVMQDMESVVARSSGELAQGVDALNETVQALNKALTTQVRRP
ncbi:hypothetical protein OWM54_08220 [Myxococcus sp. MISCRS1]|uniref:hypothetical protein n=1 Tax=unclassified Myxococcus TaxID=2648731 RepID=UPI001CBEAAAA|nr:MULTISPECIES: hypothetical protein [unclassified Myxococcus]MCY0997128.1 hypothetical protein [Myxococcus sp. MISCRS1]